MLPKPLSDVTVGDLLDLLSNQVAERATLDYKSALPGNSDQDKRDFLADVSALANTNGGDIIFGVVEGDDGSGKNNGLPASIPGLSSPNFDAERLRLTSMIRDGIEPRISGIDMAAVEGLSAGPAVVLRVPKSWEAPHMVIFKNYSRFFARSGASNFQLDVHQLRRAFLSGPQTAERIRRLHADRLVRIVAREGLGQVLAGPVITFHAIPFAAAEGVAETVNLGELIAPRSGVALRPLGEPSLGFSPRFNSNGLISERRLRHNEVAGYLQVFRDGVIESVDAFSIAGHVSVGGKAGMVALQTARDLLMAVDSLGPIIRTLPLPLPIAVIVTVIGAAGLPLIRSDGTFVYSSATIDSDHWLLPDVVISETYVDAGRLLRPVFDGIWQAAGQSACPHYDASGQWNGGY